MIFLAKFVLLSKINDAPLQQFPPLFYKISLEKNSFLPHPSPPMHGPERFISFTTNMKSDIQCDQDLSNKQADSD